MSKIRPWLSIVVPAHNAERFLGTCVASIDPDRHGDVQVVLVDDGSTDATPKLCDDLADAHGNVNVVHKLNGGPPSARNAGFAWVEADWVWFVDSDDLIAPGALGILKPLIVETDADAIQISFVVFSGVDEPRWRPLVPSSQVKRITSDEFIRGLYRGSYRHYMWTFLVRTERLRTRNGHTPAHGAVKSAAGPFREEFSLYDDVVSTEDLLRRISRVDVLGLEMYGYRQISSSVTHGRSDKAADSGLRAVRDLQGYEVASDVIRDKIRMEVGLLFSAYKLVEDGDDSEPLKRAIRAEIDSRVAKVGAAYLGPGRLARYTLMRTGLMDLIISWRSRG